MFWRIAKFILFRFDPEWVHGVAIKLLRVSGHLPRITAGTSLAKTSEISVMGMKIRNRVGLAAGFDKDGEAILGLERLGFGFIEIGTLTPLPQSGNLRPRLFRDPARMSLLNRMGFNNGGAKLAAERFKRVRNRLPEGFLVGVNVGKNKDTSLETAELDYALAVTPFEGLADYFVLNVSSPNTPGLRNLQNLDSLKKILDAVLKKMTSWRRIPPVLLKLAPEVGGGELKSIMKELEGTGVGGWILTNTLKDSEGKGGWSGGLLTEMSRRRLMEARDQTRLPIVSVGGILSAEDAVERCAMGADLVQIYSGWIFRGPQFVSELRAKLAQAGF